MLSRGQMFGRRRLACYLHAACVLVPVLLVTACAHGGGGAYVSRAYAPTQYYPPPGPPSDPWGPYIREAAARFGIPEQWIRAVMHQESDGQEQAVSPVGAIGLMQIMPATYEELRDENGLGDDPFNPHDNILAGAAYIKQMYDRYGAPGFLAAYNAGPGEVDDFLAGGGPLPDETVNYLAAVTPNLGDAVPLSGPFAQYASAGGGVAPSARSFATGCDVNAAYDPGHPCAAEPPPAELAGPEEVASANPSAGACDSNLAYDPDSPCSGTGGSTGSCDADRAFDPQNPCAPVVPPAVERAAAAPPLAEAEPSAPPLGAVPDTGSALYQPAVTAPAAPSETASDVASAVVVSPPPAAVPVPAASAPTGDWGIQVGAFASAGLARAVAEGARAEAPDELGGAAVALPAMQPFGGLVLYRAQLVNLTASAAIDACSRLNHRQLPCIVLPANGA